MQIVGGRSLVLHLMDITVRPYVRSFFFAPVYFNAPCRFTPLLNLRSLSFSI